MAVQFPNFLNVPVRTPDYSGIGDIVSNYYQGYNAPKDALIKSIQAKFAQPEAEQTLLSTKLSNRKQQLDINKLAIELSQQQELQRQLAKALGGGGASPSAPQAAAGMNQPVSPAPASPLPMSYMNDPSNAVSGINPALGAALSQSMQSQPQAQDSAQQAPSMPMAAPSMQPPAPSDSAPEIVVTKGSPNLAGIDAMYDSNPLSRDFLEKKGFKKSQEVKFDNKTGKTTVITKYPSGKVTVQAMASDSSGEGMPLTNRNITKHQSVVSSVDVALPVIDKILNMNDGDYSRLPTTNRGAKYNSLVSQSLDTLLGAFALPSSNEGLDTVRSQLLIGHMESPSAYRKRLRELRQSLVDRQKYSSGLLKKAVPIGDDGEDDVKNMSDEELRALANG